MLDHYIAILMDARRAVLSEYGNNEIAKGIAYDLTAIINGLCIPKSLAMNENIYYLQSRTDIP
jgi:hypothetical protein